MEHPYAEFVGRVEKPARYLGGEYQSVRKDPSTVDVSVALAFPDVYDIGMSHLGTKILYSLLNRDPRIACERAFAPWTDMESELRARQLPLVTLESARPLSAFDVVGISLQYEMTYTNVLTLLDLVTSEKSKDQKAIVTERWQIPSQMPYAYEVGLARGAARKPGDVVPDDSMTWSFVGGTLDPWERREIQNRNHQHCRDSKDPVQRGPRKRRRGKLREHAEQQIPRLSRIAQVDDQIGVQVGTHKRGRTKNQLREGGIECEVLFASGYTQQRIDGSLKRCHPRSHDE